MEGRFWTQCDKLVSMTGVVIDRPKGSKHPRWSFSYPLDYGYLADTRSGDGAGIDIWRGSLDEEVVTGVIVTVDVLKRDSEIKLLLGCTPDEAQTLLRVHDDGSQAALLFLRGEHQASSPPSP